MPIVVRGTDAALRAVSRLARTEDVALTPEGDRLAVACYGRRRPRQRAGRAPRATGRGLGTGGWPRSAGRC